MLAVSGAHVSYVLLGSTYLLQKLKFSKKISNSITIFLLLFFMALTGATPSVIRACIMASYLIICKITYQKPQILVSLTIPMLALLIQNPYSIFSSSLQLSYGGTIGILIFCKPLQIVFSEKFINLKEDSLEEEKTILKKMKNLKQKIIHKVIEMLTVTLSANLIVLPIMAKTFQTISITFFISNLLASPILGIVILLGFVLIFLSFICLPIAKLLSPILSLFLQILINIASWGAKLPFSKSYIATPSLWVLILYYIFLFLIFYISYLKRKIRKRKFEKRILKMMEILKKRKRRFFLCSLSVILIVTIFFSILPKDLKIYFIDVGQGDSTLIITPRGKSVLIDGGGNRDTLQFDVGKQILLPYLLNRGITKIDYIIPSHLDEDHVGGLLTILENLPVHYVIMTKQGKDSQNYQKLLEIVKRKNIKLIYVKIGDRINLDRQVNLEILWPKEEQITENILNNNSIVCKLTYGSFSILFTGDIEEIAETAILNTYTNKNILQATVLKIAHHGSKSSSIEPFLETVNPKIALIGVGEKNTFGHPNKGVIERLEKWNVDIYRTDIHGEISMVTDGKSYKIKKQIQD